MKRFLVCMTRSDDFLHASYFILNDLCDAKDFVYQNLPDIDTLNEDNEGNRNLKIACKVWMGKYKYLVEIERGIFTITYQIIPISIDDMDHICVSHNYPGDMDFQVEKIGTHSDCFDIFKKFETDISFIEIKSDYSRVFPSGESAGFVVDIFQYHSVTPILNRVTRECSDEDLIELGKFQNEKNAFITLKIDFINFLGKHDIHIDQDVSEVSGFCIHHDVGRIQYLLSESEGKFAFIRFDDIGKTYIWNIEKV